MAKNSHNQKLNRCEAVLLRTSSYGEADSILTLYSLEFGLLKGFARGAKKSTKRFGGSMGLFSSSVFHFRDGGGELKSIIDSEHLVQRTSIVNDTHAFGIASYCLELVELLSVPDQSGYDIYQLLSAFLDYIDQGGDAYQAKLLFELRLINLLGYLPHLTHCSECNASLRMFLKAFFDVSRGGALCHSCGSFHGLTVAPGTLGSLARSLKSEYTVFSGFKLGALTTEEAGKVLDDIYREILPKEPRTLKFIKQLDYPRS